MKKGRNSIPSNSSGVWFGKESMKLRGIGSKNQQAINEGNEDNYCGGDI